jgi:hypothetical protein
MPEAAGFKSLPLFFIILFKITTKAQHMKTH